MANHILAYSKKFPLFNCRVTFTLWTNMAPTLRASAHHLGPKEKNSVLFNRGHEAFTVDKSDVSSEVVIWILDEEVVFDNAGSVTVEPLFRTLVVFWSSMVAPLASWYRFFWLPTKRRTSKPHSEIRPSNEKPHGLTDRVDRFPVWSFNG